jgi:hypothetical protein
VVILSIVRSSYCGTKRWLTLVHLISVENKLREIWYLHFLSPESMSFRK